jgi:hypothetical protein
MTALDALVWRLSVGHPSWPAGGTDRVRIERLLLGYAASQLLLLEQPGGAIVPSVRRPNAQAVLDLPLFPRRDGPPVTGWRLVLEFCGFGEAAAGDPKRQTCLQQVLWSGPPAHLLAWIRQVLSERRIVRPNSAGAKKPKLPPRGRDASERDPLARTLTHWLEVLRPDTHLGPPGNREPTWVALVSPDLDGFDDHPAGFGDGTLAHYTERLGFGGKPEGSVLYVDRHHERIAACRERASDPEPLAWLLLGCYAQINEQLYPVTNEHELQFQRRVIETLLRGELTWRE